MNRDMPYESSKRGQAPLPAEVRNDRRVSRTVHPPRASVADNPPAQTPVDAPATPPPSRTLPTVRTALICGVLLVGLAAVLVPALMTAVKTMKDNPSAPSIGEALGDSILQGGLPPTHTPPPNGMTDTEEGTGDPAETFPVSEPDTLPEVPSPDSETTNDGDSPGEEDSTDLSDDSTPPVSSESTPGEIEPNESAPAESDPAENVPPIESIPPDEPPVDTEPETTAETEPSMPEGAFPITYQDRSETERGAGYIINTAGDLPLSLPTGRLWTTAETPTILIVNTHPYEGYSDGGDWYDPTAGGLAQTDSPNDPDGVVALGAALTRRLREQGVTVIHLRVAVNAGETAGTIYDRTEELVRYYCDLYPEIGLVLDLRRTAELTTDGHILATSGTWNKATVAQARLSVNADRTEESVARDLAVALSIREELWKADPSLSRPALARTGKGLVSDRDGLVSLTLDIGSAGNTYEEAARLVDPLVDALVRVVTMR